MNDAAFGEAASRTYFELSRLQYMEQWWQWPLLFLTILLVGIYVVGLYLRDGIELSRSIRWLLTFLRLAGFAGIFFFFLGLEKRTEFLVTKNSRAIVAIDTSQSMGLADPDPATNPDGITRAEQVSTAITNQSLLAQLQQKHDVLVYRFDQNERPEQLAMLPRQPLTQAIGDTADNVPTELNLNEAQWLLKISGGFLAIGLVALLLHFQGPRWLSILRSDQGESWPLLVSIVSIIIGLVVAGVSNLRNPDVTIAQLMGRAPAETQTVDEKTVAPTSEEPTEVDWATALQPSGVSTRIGDVLRSIVETEKGGPIAGICLITDGNSNSGTDWRESLQLTKEAEIPVFALGMGSDRPPTNARIVDVEAPTRVYPGDSFILKAYLQSYGLAGQSVQIQLLAQDLADPNETERIVDDQVVNLPEDGEVDAVEFEVEPEEKGKTRYIARVLPPAGDLDSRDNQQVADVKIIDRQSRLLLLAGGPTREYRFLRVMCFRDPEVRVDVHIQGSPTDIAQDADSVLPEFPATAEELFEYDSVVAFDPDWSLLTDQQIALLERWVAEKAGGLVLIAGPVHTPLWSSLNQSRLADETLKSLYPVSFYRRSGGLLSRSRYTATQAWPVNLTDEGMSARFLWLGDSASISEDNWNRFSGVFGYQPIRGVKPGATVYARFSDPETMIDGQLPVFLAGQFYGAGRVLFLASGEMWRLNELDVSLFEKLYTQIIRYVSEGRLSRDSSRGVLLVSKDRCILGETIVIRASLSNAQFQPLVRDRITVTIASPNGQRQETTLLPLQETGQEGIYVGQMTALAEGDYQIELPVPDSPELEILARTVRVRLPDREVEAPQRNDALLNELADATGGKYFVGLDSIYGIDNAEENHALANALKSQDQETYFPGAPDKDFQQRLMGWLLFWIFGTFGTEWLLRRLYRLA